jgi:hypothetical protein
MNYNNRFRGITPTGVTGPGGPNVDVGHETSSYDPNTPPPNADGSPYIPGSTPPPSSTPAAPPPAAPPAASSSTTFLGLPRYAWYIGAAVIGALLLIPSAPKRRR